MNMISRTALSNFRKNKSRNLLIGAAIALTTFLLTAVPTAIFGFITIHALAMAVRCFCPPESVLGSAFKRSSMPML